MFTRKYAKKTRKPMRRFRRKPVSKYTRGGSGQISALKTLTAPDKLIVKLPYYTEFPLNSATQTAFHYWRNNSIYDPDGTGIGHQPLGYDQWSQFYGRYRVLGAKYRITISNPSPVACKVAVLGVNGVYSGASDETSMEHAHISTRVVGGAAGKDVVEFIKYFANTRIAGVSAATYKADDRFQSQFGANPLETISAVIQARALSTQSTVSLNCAVHITYMVELFDRNDLPISNTAPEVRGPDDGPNPDA